MTRREALAGIAGGYFMETTAADVVLSCRPEIEPDKLTISYSVSNHGPREVYVLDVLPTIDMATRKPVPNPGGVYVCAQGGGAALVLKGIPPLPADRMVTVRMIPLGTRVASGEQVERTFDLSVPLEELSPYYLPLKPEQYDVVEITSVVFMVHFLRTTVPGFHAEPAPHGAGFFRLRSEDIVAQASSLKHAFNVPSLKLKRRKDHFGRI